MMRERDHRIRQRESDHFVDGVVTPDVLADREHRAVELKRSRRRGGHRSRQTRAGRRGASPTARAEWPARLARNPTAGATRRRIESMLVLPHTPQLELMTKLRLRRARSPSAGTFSTMSMALGSGAPLRPRTRRISPSSLASFIKPSANRNPAASSSSWPGVRMVSVKRRPASRISSGSSTASCSIALR